MSSRTLNFDNFMVEKKQDPIIVTVFGKEYPVKPEIPAVVMVTLARTNDTNISDFEATQMMIRAGDALFGKSVVDEFCRNGMQASQLIELIKMVFETINGKDVDGEDVEDISDEDGMVSANGNKAKK